MPAKEGGDSFSTHICVPVRGLCRDLWHVLACKEHLSSGLLLGLSGVKVGDDGWKDRWVANSLQHHDNSRLQKKAHDYWFFICDFFFLRRFYYDSNKWYSPLPDIHEFLQQTPLQLHAFKFLKIHPICQLFVWSDLRHLNVTMWTESCGDFTGKWVGIVKKGTLYAIQCFLKLLCLWMLGFLSASVTHFWPQTYDCSSK